MRCENCQKLITEYDDDFWCRFKGAEYFFCCERCALEWLADHQEEINQYVLNDSGLFCYEMAPKEREE